MQIKTKDINNSLNLQPFWTSIILTTLFILPVLMLSNSLKLIDIGIILFSLASIFSVAILIEQNIISRKPAIFILIALTIMIIHPKISTPVYPATFMDFNVNPHFIVTLITGWAILLYSIFKNISVKNPYRIPLYFLLLGSITSMYFCIDRRLYVLWLIWLTYFAANFYVSSFYLQDYKEKVPSKHWGILSIILISGILLFVSAAFKNYGTSLAFFMNRARGVFTNPNALGVFSATSLFLFLLLFFKKRFIFKIIGGVAVMLSLYIISISVSRNAIVSLLAGAGVLIFMLFNKNGSTKNLVMSVILTILLMLLSIILILKSGVQLSERFETAIHGREVSSLLRLLMAKYTITYLVQNPLRALLGNGIYQFYYYKFSFGLANPHNMLPDWWFSFGLFGLLAFFSIVYISYIKPLIKVFKKRAIMHGSLYFQHILIISSLTTFWFSTLFDEVYWYPHHPILFAILPIYLVVTHNILSTLDSSSPS